MAVFARNSSYGIALLQRYLEACEKQGVVANLDLQNSISVGQDSSSDFALKLNLDQLTEADMTALADVLSYLNNFAFHAVDVLHNSKVTSGDLFLRVLRSINQKLRLVDLKKATFGRDFMRELLHRGLQCQHLNMSFLRFRKLDMIGHFPGLHTLILDYSVHLADLPEGCFRATPSLARISMCETKVANLWTTCAALTKIPALVELRFQSCKCCENTGHCKSFTTNGLSSMTVTNLKHFEQLWEVETNVVPIGDFASMESEGSASSNTDGLNDGGYFSDVDSMLLLNPVHTSSDESSTDNDDESEDQEITRMDDELNFRGDILDSLSEESNTVINFISEIPESRLDSSASHTSFLNQQYASQGSPDTDDRITTGSRHSHVEYNLGISPTGNRPEYRNKLQNSAHLRQQNSVFIRHCFYHPSLICSEKHYRDFMLANLPGLTVLDNLKVTNAEREKARSVFAEHFENLLGRRQHRHSMLEVLKGREISSGAVSQSSSKMKSSMGFSGVSFTRLITASKMSSCSWPSRAPLCKEKVTSQQSRKYKPRQFEYHPSDPALMVFGTLHGEVVVVNHESDTIVGQAQSNGSSHSILGLCWLNKDPSKLIAGADNGSLQLYDIDRMRSSNISALDTSNYRAQMFHGQSGRRSRRNPVIHVYENFGQLTSVHVNCSDEYFLASGYSKNVGLYDLCTGKQLQIFSDLHQHHINVVKFAHHSPNIFATSSFDLEIKMWDLRQRVQVPLYTIKSTRGNVMVCFSQDDYYLLASAVDNEVKQHLAVDGRLHLHFDIPSSGSNQNYTRSYYMNGRDYVISGSCEENVVRIYSAQTGRRLRDVALEGRGSKSCIYVQSLRGDPFRSFHFGVLAAYFRPYLKSEILKVNLLANNIHKRNNESDLQQELLAGMGA